MINGTGGCRRHGSTASQYLSGSLKLAWAAAKELAGIDRLIASYEAEAAKPCHSAGMVLQFHNRVTELEDRRDMLVAVFATAA